MDSAIQRLNNRGPVFSLNGLSEKKTSRTHVVDIYKNKSRQEEEGVGKMTIEKSQESETCVV